AGAHSHLAGWRFADAASPRRYIDSVERAVPAAAGPLDAAAMASLLESMQQVTFREEADGRREMAETVILALRLREGLDVEGFERRFGVPLEAVFGEALTETQDLGLVELRDGRLRLR